MFREQRDPAKVVWSPVNDELLLSRVKRFAGRVHRRERGWAIIAEPFHPGMSVVSARKRVLFSVDSVSCYSCCYLTCGFRSGCRHYEGPQSLEIEEHEHRSARCGWLWQRVGETSL